MITRKGNKRVTVKIGSNVLARRDGTLDVTQMSSLVDQICRVREAGVEVILISSGAVASGRSELNTMSISNLDDVSSRQLFSAVGQVKLMSRYYDLFASHGINVGQVLTMKESFSTRRHYLNQRNCMDVMLANGVVPIVNENDTVSVTELMFTDNDELSGLVAAMMDCDSLVLLSNIDGVYDGDPNDPSTRLIEEIDGNTDFSQSIQTTRSGFGRGGMLTKYRIARKVADQGIKVMIANGRREGILPSLLLDGELRQPCTIFIPSEGGKSNVKRWIASSEGFAKGAVTIDDAAIRAISSARAVSLLPVGVTAVSGEFEKDDLIKVVSSDGRQIGIGRSSYSSAEARELMGHHECRPLIHYDYLYIDIK